MTKIRPVYTAATLAFRENIIYRQLKEESAIVDAPTLHHQIHILSGASARDLESKHNVQLELTLLPCCLHSVTQINDLY